MGGGLPRPGGEDRCDHADVAVGGAFGRAAGRPVRDALWSHSDGSRGSAETHRDRKVTGGGATPLAPTISQQH